MSTLPLTEAILLEIHQSLGCPSYPTTKKNKFATGAASLKTHKTMGEEILQDIFKTLDIEPTTALQAMDKIMEFTNAYKSLELNTWTFNADQRQIVWMLLGYFYAPGTARQAGFLSIDNSLDKGMPGGRFWYLPEIQENNGAHNLYLPVAQVVDWLLDLLGMPIEQFADKHSRSLGDSSGYISESLTRTLYNWRRDTLPTPKMISEYFPDDMEVPFKGTFSVQSDLSISEQFEEAIKFVKRKQLTADKLRMEIPMTLEGRLETILNGLADDNEKNFFVHCLAERYATPSPRLIRQRLLIARMVQDGYVRLLKFLYPGVERQCADPNKNKLLQIFGIYKLVYNATIDASRHCGDQDEATEEAWFEKHLPLQYKYGLLLDILPSHRETANLELAHFLTKFFSNLKAGSELENHVGYDAESEQSIIKRNFERRATFEDEITSELSLVERMKNSSPWRVLQSEHRYWVISQVAQHTELNLRAKAAVVQRLRELASTAAETLQAIDFELSGHFNCNKGSYLPKESRAQVQALLEEAEASEGYDLWKAAILQYKAKHALACNDFKEAGKLFREALEAASERNYGRLRGEIALDCLALEVANQKLILNNHEKYYREMLAGGIVNGDEIPSIEDTAVSAANYFWGSLYKTYRGIERTQPLSLTFTTKPVDLMMSGDLDGLRAWINSNHTKLNTHLRLTRGDSLLMLFIKLRTTFKNLPEIHSDLNSLENIRANWRQGIRLLVENAPKQLNISDFKRQTPLMLMAEEGDIDLVRIMLHAGADPDMQDWHGMTALHSAIKSRSDNCVDALLDHPCSLDKCTIDGNSPLHTASWTANVHAINRLLQLVPGLVRQRNKNEQTPLELVEYLIENHDALEFLTQEAGGRCGTLKDLQNIAQILEQALHLTNH